MQHTIVIDPSGSVEYTRNPILDKLFEGERKSVTRMTNILFNEEQQQYYIKFETGPFYGITLDWFMQDSRLEDHTRRKALRNHFERMLKECNPDIVHTKRSDCRQVLFATYELAVAMEIALVNYLRDFGYSMQ